MTSSPSDSRANQGLTNALSNVFKLGEVDGLKWVRYVGPPSTVMEIPKHDPVLSSYAKLLNEGYACAWRCHCPGTDGSTEETKDLWLFYFTQERPDFGDKLGSGLKEEGSGSWEDGMTVDSTTMLYRALNNLIERSLLSENFLPLGKWFARPDSSVSTDGNSKGVFLCSFSFFIHAHLFICASVDLRCGPGLQPLVKTHINQALASSNGLQVVLSPSGLNAVMTGHSYKATDPGIQDILEEWKLFYPRRFSIEPPPGLPSAVEVVLGGVRVRYPSQFVFVYHSEETLPTPPPSPTDPSLTKELVESVWESTGCVEPVRQQLESAQCKCQDTSAGRVGPKRPADLSAIKFSHATKRPRSDAPAANRDVASTPGSLSLSIPILHTKRKPSQFGMQPKYTTPLPSPAITSPPHKPSQQLPLPIPLANAAASHSSSQKVYDPSRINGLGTVGTYVGAGRRWWDCLALPEGTHLSSKQPSVSKVASSGTLGVPTLSSLLSPTSKKFDGLYPGAGVTTMTDTAISETIIPSASVVAKPDPGSEKKPAIIDHFSEKAVKISTALDQIFDSDGEEDNQPDTTLLLSEKVDTNVVLSSVTKTTKIAGTDISLSELSRIYPTPPSVESMEEKYDDGKGFGEDRIDHHGVCDVTQHYDEELGYIPLQFAPLPNIRREKLPKHCVYEQAQKNALTPLTAGNKSSSLSVEKDTQNRAEPNTFIFPPPSTIVSRAQRIEALTLPGFHSKRPSSSYLTTPQQLNTPHTGSFLSPSFPRPPSRPYRPLSSAATPLESPFDSVTPTPVGPNRLIPVLAEAHGLYINLSLLDSALGANFSEPPQINTGSLMSTLHQFYTQRRMKLDSVESAATVALDTTDTPDLFSVKEEKPVMTFGIADYPSLGFREGVGPGASDKATDTSGAPFGALSKLMGMLGVNSKEAEQTGTAFPMNKFLEFLQDYSMDLCFHGNMPEGSAALCEGGEGKRHDKKDSQSGGRLYHSHSVVSAITAGKQLLQGIKGKPATHFQKQPQVTLSKEDNSAAWILELLALPTEFVSKRLKELRSVFQYSFQHAPCLKFSAKGPLTLKDLQQLAPSQTALGDECVPLPMQPVVVGYEHEWVSVSPLSLPIWDKLLFEPCSMKKDILYLVIAPNKPSLLPAIRKYFRDLSIVFRTCHLGQHLPIEKDPVGEGGVVLCSPGTVGATDDPFTNSRHGLPAGLTELESICSKVLEPFLSNLVLDQNAVQAYTKSYDGHPSTNQPGHPSVSQPIPPTSLVIYVVCDDDCGGKIDTFHIFHILSKLISAESIKQKTRDQALLQLVHSREIHGCGPSRGGHLRSMALSIYTRCRPTLDMMEDIKTLTTFGPASQRMQLGKDVLTTQIYAPPFVLSPETPLTHSGVPGPGGALKSQILFSPDENVLLCGYCVSPDQCWLLVACCDRQGELLDTAVIGITQMSDASQSRLVALQQLWNYLLSIVARTLVRWNIVITRLGKPSSAEIRDWPTIIDDGLLNANQMLCGTCELCMHAANRAPCDGTASPHLTNVLVLSVQPERTIQLVQTQQESTLAVSHAVVLPQDPRASTATPAPGESADDWMIAFSGGAESGDFGGVGVDILDDIEMDHIHLDTQAGITLGADASAPKATGYLISTSPCGGLPLEFWGYQKPYLECSLFKVLLHCHRSEKEFADSPQETLGSTLVCLDALSWLTVDQITEQRRSCLPIHLFILSKMHHLFGVLDQMAHKP